MKLKTLSLTLLLASSILSAEEGTIDFEKTGKWIVLPYIFSTETTGLSGGVGAIVQGLLQEQTTLVGTLYYGTEQDIINNGRNETANFSGGFISYSNLKLPTTERLFLSAWGYMNHYPKRRLYMNSTNESNDKDVLITEGQDNTGNVNLRYVLPIGEGIENPERLYKLRDGFAMDRENYGNGTPFESGRTSIGLKYFYEFQDIDNWKDIHSPWSNDSEKPEWNTSGLRFYLEHDNTDYDLNPSRGYSFLLQYSADRDWVDNSQDWDSIEFKASKYFNMDTFSFTQQNVLALNFWTAYTPSWDNNQYWVAPTATSDGIHVGQPTLFEGARLGGMFRMRGYDSNRFVDKAAIYAAVEYRAILDWNPFKTTKFLKKYSPVAIDWFQIVPFAEVGRVNDEYNADLLKDLKYDAGISIRAFAAELPIRLDVGVSDEGVNMWVMIRQPFDF